MAKTISATTAARSFSDILDKVEHTGEEFVIERHGRPVATLTPAKRLHKGLTWGEFLQLVDRLPKPDPGFAKDLRDIRRKQGRLPRRNPWASSSTRRS